MVLVCTCPVEPAHEIAVQGTRSRGMGPFGLQFGWGVGFSFGHNRQSARSLPGIGADPGWLKFGTAGTLPLTMMTIFWEPDRLGLEFTLGLNKFWAPDVLTFYGSVGKSGFSRGGRRIRCMASDHRQEIFFPSLPGLPLK